MGLRDKLFELKEGFKTRAPQDAQKIMHQATEDLRNSDMLQHVIKIGDKAPDFRIKNTVEQNVALYPLLNKGPVLLTFYRGNW